ncbi:MAG: DMT family transporter [Lachnospiraceae bacterium]|jgi:drug/metabolite transporter (DMT)-like permease|nr:DMT family transporter [Lachnospiraceae bacterium]MCI8872169.1 DMT family transporter [Lachnospiraceae bacterium]MCI9058346.1 DMT family transporter [Lachnospiraceae bacterium]
MKKYLAIAGLIAVTVIWGGGFVASDMALKSLRPFQIMAIRFLLATILMGGASIRELKGIDFKELRAGILMGCALFVGFAFQIVGLQYTTPSKNAFLTALNVVMVPFIAFLILKKKISMKSIAGAVMAIFGVGLLSLEKNLSLGLGDALTLVCAVGFAFQIFFTSEFVKKYRAVVLNFVQMLTAVLLSVVSLFLFGETEFHVTAQGWLSVLYLGVISTALCYLLQTASQRYVDETKAAIILSMESVFGTIFSILILHEQVTLRMICGCVIILAAVIVSNLADAQPEPEL